MLSLSASLYLVSAIGVRSVPLMLGHWGLPLSSHFNLHRSRQEQLLLSLVCSSIHTSVGWWVKFLYVQTISSLLRTCHRFHLKCLGAISLLRVEFPSFIPTASKRLINIKQSVSALRSLHNGLSSWVESKVSLIHQLFVKRWVHSSIIRRACNFIGGTLE